MPPNRIHTIRWQGQLYSVQAFVRLTGMPETTLYRWIERGWMSEAAIRVHLRERALREKAVKTGIAQSTAKMRVVRGWDVETAYTTPLVRRVKAA